MILYVSEYASIGAKIHDYCGNNGSEIVSGSLWVNSN